MVGCDPEVGATSNNLKRRYIYNELLKKTNIQTL